MTEFTTKDRENQIKSWLIAWGYDTLPDNVGLFISPICLNVGITEKKPIIPDENITRLVYLMPLRGETYRVYLAEYKSQIQETANED